MRRGVPISVMWVGVAMWFAMDDVFYACGWDTMETFKLSMHEDSAIVFYILGLYTWSLFSKWRIAP